MNNTPLPACGDFVTAYGHTIPRLVMDKLVARLLAKETNGIEWELYEWIPPHDDELQEIESVMVEAASRLEGPQN